MGYRSNVYIYIKESEETKRLFGSLEDIIERANAIEEVVDDEDGYSFGHDKEGVRILQVKFGDIKWYDNYSFIKYWDSIMNIFDSEDLSSQYFFTRLGESPRDFETRGELGEAYEYTDYDLSIDFYTDEDDKYTREMELRKYIRNDSGIGHIIYGDSWFKEDESKVVDEKTLDYYLSTLKK